MFTASTVWKGIVCALIVMFAKALVAAAVYIEFLFSKPLPLHRFRTRKPPQTQTTPTMNQLRSPAGTTLLPHPETATANFSQLHPPALILCFAMVACGEIGLYIASLAESTWTSTFHSPSTSPPNAAIDCASGGSPFLVLTWAMVLWTLVGPIGVGVVVRKFRNEDRGEVSAASRSLGIWG